MQNGNLTFSNGKTIQKISSYGTSFSLIDLAKGFGYIKLNPTFELKPGDSYEFYDLAKKENSFALYNNGKDVFEFGFEENGFSADILPQITPKNFGYFHTLGQRQILLNGIIEYKRIPSYAQAKGLVGSYQNYLTTNLDFFPVYTSRILSQAFFDLRSENFTSKVNTEETQGSGIVWLQNRNHHTFFAESDGQYYYKYNVQDCPGYNLYHLTELGKPSVKHYQPISIFSIRS